MRVVVTGSSGLIGSALTPELVRGGHAVTRLVRAHFAPGFHPAAWEDTLDRFTGAAVESATGGGNLADWDPDESRLEPARLTDCEAVVHLAGENIASGRWTAAKKERIRDSRVNGTRLLCETLTKLDPPPKVLVSASAVGYYGDRGDQSLAEDSPAGSGFLAEVCRQWEAATRPAADKGIRVVMLRLGVVLSARGGALARMLTPFRVGVGGRLGSGRQYMSWITLDDGVGVIQQALSNEALSGPVNAVSPNPVTNYEFTKTLGRVLGRPTLFPMPGFAARLAFGQMADEALLASVRVDPARLRAAGYVFRYPQLESALRALLGK